MCSAIYWQYISPITIFNTNCMSSYTLFSDWSSNACRRKNISRSYNYVFCRDILKQWKQTMQMHPFKAV